MEELRKGYVFGLLSLSAIDLAIPFEKGSLLTVLCLCCSLCLRPEYNGFRRVLERYLPLPDAPTLPTTNEKTIDSALKVLQTERERRWWNLYNNTIVRSLLPRHRLSFSVLKIVQVRFLYSPFVRRPHAVRFLACSRSDMRSSLCTHLNDCVSPLEKFRMRCWVPLGCTMPAATLLLRLPGSRYQYLFYYS